MSTWGGKPSFYCTQTMLFQPSWYWWNNMAAYSAPQHYAVSFLTAASLLLSASRRYAGHVLEESEGMVMLYRRGYGYAYHYYMRARQTHRQRHAEIGRYRQRQTEAVREKNIEMARQRGREQNKREAHRVTSLTATSLLPSGSYRREEHVRAILSFKSYCL